MLVITYIDLEEVNGLRKSIGVTVYRRIKFKLDGYIYLGIYRENAWKIRTSLYLK